MSERRAGNIERRVFGGVAALMFIASLFSFFAVLLAAPVWTAFLFTLLPIALAATGYDAFFGVRDAVRLGVGLLAGFVGAAFLSVALAIVFGLIRGDVLLPLLPAAVLIYYNLRINRMPPNTP